MYDMRLLSVCAGFPMHSFAQMSSVRKLRLAWIPPLGTAAVAAAAVLRQLADLGRLAALLTYRHTPWD
jgi:hypothetical protein